MPVPDATSIAASLEAQMRQVLVQLEALSHGTTMSYGAVVASKGGFGEREGGTGHPPGGTLAPPHEHFRKQWNACTTDEQRQRVLKAARAELESFTQRSVPAGYEQRPERPHERVRRILSEGEGFHFREVAVANRCGEREIIAMRREARDPRRDVDFGRPIEEQADDDKAARVRDLKHRNPGMGLRQIAQIVGVGKSTVQRYLQGDAS